MESFVGSKVALIRGNEVVLIQRDNKPGLRFAGLWDFPGGGREGNETPEECAIREIREELGFTLPDGTLVYKREWPAMVEKDRTAWFLVALIDGLDPSQWKLGDEGQSWKFMPVQEVLSSPDVVPHLKDRLIDYLDNSSMHGSKLGPKST